MITRERRRKLGQVNLSIWLDGATGRALEALAHEWGTTRTGVVERLLAQAALELPNTARLSFRERQAIAEALGAPDVTRRRDR